MRVLIWPCAGDAHWQIGAVERAIQTLKTVATRAALQLDVDLLAKVLWSLVAEAHNDLHRHEGHSPFEATLGRTPTPIDTDPMAEEPEVPLLNPSERVAAHQARRRT